MVSDENYCSTVKMNDTGREKISTAAKHFSNTTSMHGFSHLGETSHRCRVFWLCVIIVASVATALHLQSLLQQYLWYDSYESVKNEQTSLEFPDITFCSSEGMSDISMAVHQLTSIILRVITMTQRIEDLRKENPDLSDRLNKLYTGENYFANLREEEQYKLGILLDEVLIDCKFNGMSCSKAGNFVLYKHYLYFNCYTFRYNKTIEEVNVNIRSGPEHGLSLILAANRGLTSFYNGESNMANVVGFKVAIHERGTIPPIVNKGIDIHPGHSTNIALVAKKHTRLGEPFGNCFRQEVTDNDIYGQNAVKYSQERCIQEKLSKLVSESCQCISVKFHCQNSNNYEDNCFYNDGNIQNVSKCIEKALCEIDLLEGMMGDSYPECVWPCDGWSYETYMSATKWLPKSMISSFLQRYILLPSNDLKCNSPVWWYYEALLTHYKGYKNDKDVTICQENPFLKDYTKSYTREDTMSVAAQILFGHHPKLDNIINATLRPSIDPLLMEYSSIDGAIAAWIEGHFYRLNVYFRESTVEHYTQVASVSFTDLFSGVGGALGLWIGFSAITCIEIFMFLANLYRMLIAKICCGWEVGDSNDSIIKVKHNVSFEKAPEPKGNRITPVPQTEGDMLW